MENLKNFVEENPVLLAVGVGLLSLISLWILFPTFLAFAPAIGMVIPGSILGTLAANAFVGSMAVASIAVPVYIASFGLNLFRGV